MVSKHVLAYYPMGASIFLVAFEFKKNEKPFFINQKKV